MNMKYVQSINMFQYKKITQTSIKNHNTALHKAYWCPCQLFHQLTSGDGQNQGFLFKNFKIIIIVISQAKYLIIKQYQIILAVIVLHLSATGDTLPGRTQILLEWHRYVYNHLRMFITVTLAICRNHLKGVIQIFYVCSYTNKK